MRLLVIEDERDLCEDIAKKLRLSGYEADICFDGEAALELLAVEKYDLVLLDLNLPKVDGMTVLRTLREHDQETGVLILSARSEISDKVDGLDAGANDYLSKPFHLEELEARVRSLTRRRFVQQDVCLRCGGIPAAARLRQTDKRFRSRARRAAFWNICCLTAADPSARKNSSSMCGTAAWTASATPSVCISPCCEKNCVQHWDTTRSATRSVRATR